MGPVALLAGPIPNLVTFKLFESSLVVPLLVKLLLFVSKRHSADEEAHQFRTDIILPEPHQPLTGTVWVYSGLTDNKHTTELLPLITDN